MPRNGSSVYSKPAGTTAVTGTTIDSADYNATVDDLVADANLPRPVVVGGTGASTAAGARTALGLVIGTNVQAVDATLTSIAALGTAANKIAYTTGVDTWAEAAITTAGRALLDDADAAAQRTTLGLGTAATTAATAYATPADLTSLAPLPNTATGVGKWQSLGGATNFILPAGGTWAWAALQVNASGNVLDQYGGVGAGGATVSGPAAGTTFRGFAWRIT